MKEALWIGLGGFLGANARYFVSRWAKQLDPGLPWGTLLVNGLGSLLVGFVLTWVGARTAVAPAYKFAVAVGFCGAFTTFSSYAYETIALYNQGVMWRAIGNVAANNLLALVAVVAGMALARLAV